MPKNVFPTNKTTQNPDWVWNSWDQGLSYRQATIADNAATPTYQLLSNVCNVPL